MPLAAITMILNLLAIREVLAHRWAFGGALGLLGLLALGLSMRLEG